MNISPTHNHRNREKGLLVYPVYSRRSKGISLGVNLFPTHKVCSFDCPYCEVFPFKSDFPFDIEFMEIALIETIDALDCIVKDLCFSGNGEPTMSPHFKSAVNRACTIRQTHAPSAQIVVITNGTGLLKQDLFDFLIEKSHKKWFNLWLKIDAGTEEWFKTIDRPNPNIKFPTLISKIQDFTERAGGITIQTMLCSVNGSVPDEREAAAWEQNIVGLAATGNIRIVHLYGKARPSPQDPLTQALPLSFLNNRAASLRLALANVGLNTPVETFE
jgi:histidinol dehydrogenase